MSEYLTKEEIRQWRSSLEKITLEEYAQRLGKEVKGNTRSNEIVDIVLKSNVSMSDRIIPHAQKNDNIVSVAQKTFEIEKKSQVSPAKRKNASSLKAKLKFKKPLTPREETVLEEFLQRSGEVIYAKELAQILSLPNDYVYKYIKNLRTKIGMDVLENSANGGYILNVK